VSIDVWGNDTTLVGAVLVDRQGRRQGWEYGRRLYEIPGYTFYTDADECCPDDSPIMGDSGTVIFHEAAVDSVLQQGATRIDGREPPPLANGFAPQVPTMRDGLVADGRCDLWVTPLHTGVVTIKVLARRGTLRDCNPAVVEQTLQIGWRYRYRVEWKPAADSCSIRIALAAREKSKEGSTK
jgi:hypothetical protein